jgi:hypothetical protein
MEMLHKLTINKNGISKIFFKNIPFLLVNKKSIVFMFIINIQENYNGQKFKI